MTQTIGFIGVGMFAMYSIRGLRNAGNADSIILSPRGKDSAIEIAKECDCIIMETNQQVIDKSDVVILCVKPAHFEDMARDLVIKENQIVISAMAGITVDRLQSHLQGSRDIYRTLPVCSSEAGAGLVPVFPSGNTIVNTLLDPLGTVFEMKQESDFTGASISACMNGSLYLLYDAMINWFVEKGFDEKTARAFVLENVEGTVAFSKMKDTESLADIGNAIAIDGSYTLTGLEAVQKGGGLQGWTDCLDVLENEFKRNA